MATKNKELPLRRLKWHFFAGSFLFFAFIMWCAPYSSDDVAFMGLSFDTLAGYLDYALHYGNGRLLGNLCAILLCHCKLLAVVVKAGVLASCVVMLPRLLNCTDRIGFFLSFILFILIEPAVFGEVYVWTSGFSNYMPPAWLTLMILCVLKKDTCPPSWTFPAALLSCSWGHAASCLLSTVLQSIFFSLLHLSSMPGGERNKVAGRGCVGRWVPWRGWG